MLECYFRWCRWHHQDEPFCCRNECVATHTEIETFRHYREEELIETARRDKECNQKS